MSMLATSGVVLAIAVFAPAVGAAQIAGAITNVVITPPSQAGAGLKISEDWCVPDGTKAGDTFSQTLPTQLGGFPASFDLTDAAGDVIANATISTTTPAVVTFTMTSTPRPTRTCAARRSSPATSTTPATTGRPSNWS